MSLFMKDMRLIAIILRIRVKQESDGTLFTYSVSLWEKCNGKSRRIDIDMHDNCFPMG